MDDLQFSASDKDDDDEEGELEEVAAMSTSASNIDVDANYDPEAEFLSYGAPARTEDEDINDDLQVSSFDPSEIQ